MNSPALIAVTENVILPNGLHRVQLRQDGCVPDLKAVLAEYGPNDGQYVSAAVWRDERNIGHAYLAWKEYKSDPLPGM